MNLIDSKTLEEARQNLTALLNQGVDSSASLEAWLYKESEFIIRLRETVKWAGIHFRTHLDDPVHQANHDFVQTQLQPFIQEMQSALDAQFQQWVQRYPLNSNQYGRYTQLRLANRAMFRRENLPLEAREQELVSEYYTVLATVRVPWENTHITRVEAQRLENNANRTIREQAWRAHRRALLAVKPELDRILSQLVKIRQQIANNAGFTRYVDYIFAKKNRDYSPQDCRTFHQTVQSFVVPIQDRLRRVQHRRLGIERYRPWDEGVPERELPGFKTSEDMVNAALRVLNQVDEEVGSLLGELRDRNLFDLDTRTNKVSGGSNTSFYTDGLSFIVLNLAPNHTALNGLIHETGHAFHNHLSHRERLLLYRESSMEAAELASHSMEMFCLDKYAAVYPDREDQENVLSSRLTFGIRLLPHVAVIDKFQHWLYDHPEHTVAERDAFYRQIRRELSGSYVDWDSLEEEMSADWLEILHIFNYPFYFIEYGIAELGAQQLWQEYTRDPQGTWLRYKQALGLGNAQPLSEIYKTAGIRFDFSPDTVQKVMSFLQEELMLDDAYDQ